MFGIIIFFGGGDKRAHSLNKSVSEYVRLVWALTFLLFLDIPNIVVELITYNIILMVNFVAIIT